MKKLFTLFAAALVMLAAASCEKNEVLPGDTTEGKVITLKASINNGETKTSLGAGLKTLWSEGDAIAVLQDENIYEFVLTPSSAGKEEGVFTCNNPGDFDPEGEIIALYPFSAFKIDGKATFEIPQTQKYVPNSFDNGAVKMFAVGTNDNLIFYNLLGVVKLSISSNIDNEEVESIVLTSDQQLWGTGIVRVDGDSKCIAIELKDYEQRRSITLKCDDAVAINGSGADFFIAVHDGCNDAAMGHEPNPHLFEVIVHTNKGSYYKKASQANSVEAGKILAMPAISTTDMAPAYIENGVCYGSGVTIGETIWAPVNCGYEPADGEYKGYPYGKLYQWGRKYGQGYNSTYDATTPEISIGHVILDVGQSESNMNVLFRNFMDWLSSPDDKLWNSRTEESPMKTDYDPCPNGWRVPTKGELSNLCQNRSSWTTNAAGQQGFWFSGATSYTQEVPQVFFPAAGYHHYQADPGQGRNVNGDYWSSIANQGDNTAYNLTIEKGDGFVSFDRAIITEGDFRANGYSVRCVKE